MNRIDVLLDSNPLDEGNNPPFCEESEVPLGITSCDPPYHDPERQSVLS